MACYVRLMRSEDIPQVSDIDREAFPAQWPPPNFRHELRNSLARYMVACDGNKTVEVPLPDTSIGNGLAGLLEKLGRWLKGGNNSDFSELTRPGHYVAGYVGFWYIPDEAHITSIAVREAHQRQGIGEMLLIASIDTAKEMNAGTVTLEVRVSNLGAQKLYAKYGFNQAGVRKGYYTDNREDGIVMTTDNIHSARFQERFEQLKLAHQNKWGVNTDKTLGQA